MDRNNLLLCLETAPPTIDGKYQGYAFKNGKLVKKGMVSEDFAKQHEVWVVGVNERVDEKGIFMDGILADKSSKIASPNNTKIVSVTIKGKGCMKEDWVGGGPELWVQRHLQDPSSYPYLGVFYGNSDKDYQAQVQQFSRKDVRKSKTKTPNFPYISNWQTDVNYSQMPQSS